MGIKLRDALKQIGINQDTGELRIRGTSVVSDQDKKFIISDDLPELQSYTGDVAKWEKGSLAVGSASIEVGWQVVISDTGTSLAYAVNKEANTYNVAPFYKFNESGTVEDLKVSRLIGDPNQETTYNTGTTNHDAVLSSGTYSLSKTVTTSGNFLNWKQKIRVGTTTPTSPVKFSVYEDTDAEDITKKLIQIWLPISLWNGKSPGDTIEFYYTGSQDKKTPIQITDGITYYVLYESSSAFSLYGDVTSVQGAVIGQAYIEDRISIKTITFLTSTGAGTLEADHVAETDYIADTTLNEIELSIPYGTTAPFRVFDKEIQFNVANHEFTVIILDSEGSPAHTAMLNTYNKSYYFVYDPDEDYWYYSIDGEGEFVKIASDHVSSTDFCCCTIIDPSTATATAMLEGAIRYRTEANASHYEMVMQTGAGTYAWTTIKTNSW